ncbi:hypothetical protein SKAU_G00106190 [Synaphobranchus kaupii]|uniref:Uncharacterized protein n=1 Tax=Synaphobranchus kaupii TaxID=118154 RepID=A0A9Q1J7X0_SYNKA|nr:hypothetical protein SKAU_G00106190 [Synaphobranchus kaupii]
MKPGPVATRARRTIFVTKTRKGEPAFPDDVTRVPVWTLDQWNCSCTLASRVHAGPGRPPRDSLNPAGVLARSSRLSCDTEEWASLPAPQASTKTHYREFPGLSRAAIAIPVPLKALCVVSEWRLRVSY